MKKTRYIAKPFPKNIKQAVFLAQNGICAMRGCTHPIDPVFGFHHTLENTKSHNLRFPILMSSPLICCGLCLYDHTNHPHLFRITEAIAEVWEEWLRNFRVSMPFSSDEANGITYQKIGRGL